MLSPFSDPIDFTSKPTLEKFAISFDENISFVRVLCTTVLSKLTTQQELNELPIMY